MLVFLCSPLDVPLSLPRPAIEEQTAAPMLAALAFFFLMTSYYIIRPLRDQISGVTGSQALPLFYLAVLVAVLLLTPLFGWLMARFPRRQLLGWSYGFFTVCLLAFVPAFMQQQRIGARELGAVFFAWVSVFNLFAVSLFWSFLADIFSSGQARRTFSLIALAGMGGAIFGPLLESVLLPLIGVASLLIVSAIALVLTMILLLSLSADDLRPGSRSGEAIGGSIWAGIKQLWSRPFLRYMALLMLFGDGIGTLAYALVADYVKAHMTTEVARTSFYNDLNLATNLLGAALQLTMTRWLLIRRGAAWGLLLPAVVNVALLAGVALVGGGPLLLFGCSVPVLAAMLAVSRGFAYGMTKPATDALYTRVPRETRYKGKNFVETAVWRFGDLLVTTAVTELRALGWGVSGMAMLGAGVAALAAIVARRAGWSTELAPEELAAGRSDHAPSD